MDELDRLGVPVFVIVCGVVGLVYWAFLRYLEGGGDDD